MGNTRPNYNDVISPCISTTVQVKFTIPLVNSYEQGIGGN